MVILPGLSVRHFFFECQHAYLIWGVASLARQFKNFPFPLDWGGLVGFGCALTRIGSLQRIEELPFSVKQNSREPEPEYLSGTEFRSVQVCF